MLINHIIQVGRSRFYPIIVDAIRKAGVRFPDHPLTCELGKPKGYSGDIDISVTKGLEFEAAWEYPDPSRFPQRIRAAATALRDTDHCDRFHVSHHGGALRICKI